MRANRLASMRTSTSLIHHPSTVPEDMGQAASLPVRVRVIDTIHERCGRKRPCGVGNQKTNHVRTVDERGKFFGLWQQRLAFGLDFNVAEGLFASDGQTIKINRLDRKIRILL